ncbi:hypothetical protein [Geitlerinema sp. PCC 7407]|nr:hypothetical protein [Geitlerinema sp. PCC 7407]AFY67165.1 hypothetical protein GEI7407_2692 [Geitlerinema sp. PCC 7407]
MVWRTGEKGVFGTQLTEFLAEGDRPPPRTLDNDQQLQWQR